MAMSPVFQKPVSAKRWYTLEYLYCNTRLTTGSPSVNVQHKLQRRSLIKAIPGKRRRRRRKTKRETNKRTRTYAARYSTPFCRLIFSASHRSDPPAALAPPLLHACRSDREYACRCWYRSSSPPVLALPFLPIILCQATAALR